MDKLDGGEWQRSRERIICLTFTDIQGKTSAPAAKAAPAPAEEDDDDVDLFGSDDESDDEEKKRITEERLKAYHEKKVRR